MPSWEQSSTFPMLFGTWVDMVLELAINLAYTFTPNVKNSFVEKRVKFLHWLLSTSHTVLETFRFFLFMQISRITEPTVSIQCSIVLCE